MQRDFKGIWIPKEIWLSRDLTLQEKVFLAEIDSLDNNDGCFASNQYFAEFFQLSKNRCSEIIKSLEEKSFITVDYIRGEGGKNIEKRVLRVVDKSNRGIRKIDRGIRKIEEGYSGKCEENNTTINNTNNNTKEYTKKTVKENRSLSSTSEIESFVDLKINALPSGVERDILINYFDCIRMTRRTCVIRESVLTNLIDKIKKYTPEQINYALWTHYEKHDDKDEKYTLGILRRMDQHEAMRGLMKLRNQHQPTRPSSKPKVDPKLVELWELYGIDGGNKCSS